MTILWWHWLVFGLVLVAGELAAPGGFYIIFFGAAAILVGLLSVVGMAGPLWVQLLLFSVLSIGSLWYFRSRLMAIFQRGSPDEPVDALVGQSCRTLGALAPRGAGQVATNIRLRRSRTDDAAAQGPRPQDLPCRAC